MLRLTAQITACVGGGKIDTQRYYDIIRPVKKRIADDNKTAEDIVNDIADSIGLEIVEGGED